MKQLSTGIKTSLKGNRISVTLPTKKFKHLTTGICFTSNDYYLLKKDVYHISDNKHFRTAKAV